MGGWKEMLSTFFSMSFMSFMTKFLPRLSFWVSIVTTSVFCCFYISYWEKKKLDCKRCVNVPGTIMQLRQTARDRLRQAYHRRVNSFAASVEESTDTVRTRLGNAIAWSKASLSRKNKFLRSSLTKLEARYKPIDICLSRCSTGLEDNMICDTPVSIHSGRMVELKKWYFDLFCQIYPRKTWLKQSKFTENSS